MNAAACSDVPIRMLLSSAVWSAVPDGTARGSYLSLVSDVSSVASQTCNVIVHASQPERYQHFFSGGIIIKGSVRSQVLGTNFGIGEQLNGAIRP